MEVPVSDFGAEIRASVARARRSLAAAREDGDEYLVEVLVSQLESLTRIAADHHVVLDSDESAA